MEPITTGWMGTLHSVGCKPLNPVRQSFQPNETHSVQTQQPSTLSNHPVSNIQASPLRMNNHSGQAGLRLNLLA